MTFSPRYLKFLQIKPLICGALLGASGALCFYCMIGAMFLNRETHPYFVPFCSICGFVALIACFVILMWSFHRFSLVNRKVLVLLGMLAVTILFFCLCLPAWEWIILWARKMIHPHLM